MNISLIFIKNTDILLSFVYVINYSSEISYN